MREVTVTAEKRVRPVIVKDAPEADGRSDLDRRADALATLAGFVRRAFIGRVR